METETDAKVGSVKKNVQNAVHTRRYDFREEVGRGTWGVVYRALDREFDNRSVAIKVLQPTSEALEQMNHRNLDLVSVMKHEDGKLAACAHVVPRVYSEDAEGVPFIVMPFYKRFLSDVLRNNSGKPLENELALKYLGDAALGLREVHGKLRRAHGDLKPDNLALADDGDLLINDLGSSTCASMGISSSPRDRVGYRLTRAPECFEDGSRHTSRTDVWGWGSLATRLLTGEYALESALNGVENPDKFIAELSAEEGNRLVSKVVKKAPRRFRSLLTNCLNFDSYKRPYDGRVLSAEFEKVKDKFAAWSILKEQARKGVMYFGLPAALAAAATVAITNHEPSELSLPSHVRGPLYLEPDKTPVTFSREDIQVTAKDREPNGMWGDHTDQLAKASTENRSVAYLLSKYMKVPIANPGLDGRTTHQQRVYSANNHDDVGGKGYPGYYWLAPARSIELAMKESVNPDGTVDLEDTLVRARVGNDVLEMARKVTGSFDYKVYRDAKGADGKPIIPPNDRKYIDIWLGYINSEGVDFSKK